jgi:hypothetical protein
MVPFRLNLAEDGVVLRLSVSQPSRRGCKVFLSTATSCLAIVDRTEESDGVGINPAEKGTEKRVRERKYGASPEVGCRW